LAHKSEHALLYMDLDQFKIVNDTCGHVAGDELLRQLATLLQKIARKSDTFSRLGGDEFGFLLENCSLERAKMIAEDILKTVSKFSFSWETYHFRIGASIGLVCINSCSGDLTNILGRADSACYTAKDTGRNRICIFEEDDVELS